MGPQRCWSFVWWRRGGRGDSPAWCGRAALLRPGFLAAQPPAHPFPIFPGLGQLPGAPPPRPWPPARLRTRQGPPRRRGPSPAAPPPMMSRPWPPLGRPRAPPPPPLAPSPLGPPACDSPPLARAPSLRLPLPRERRRRRDGQGPRPGPGERRAAAAAAGRRGDRAPGGLGRSAAAPAAGAAARGSGRPGAPGHSGAWRRLRLLARRRPCFSTGRASAAVAAAPATTVAAADLHGRSLPLSDGRSAPRWAPSERGAAAALQPGLGALLDAERGHPGLQHRGAEVSAPPELARWLDRLVSPSSCTPSYWSEGWRES